MKVNDGCRRFIAPEHMSVPTLIADRSLVIPKVIMHKMTPLSVPALACLLGFCAAAPSAFCHATAANHIP